MLLYNGFGVNTKAFMRMNKGLKSEKLTRGNYGAALTNVIFGITIASTEEFKQILEKLDCFAYPPLDEGTPKAKSFPSSFPPSFQSSSSVKSRGNNVLNKIVQEGQKELGKDQTQKVIDYKYEERPTHKKESVADAENTETSNPKLLLPSSSVSFILQIKI